MRGLVGKVAVIAGGATGIGAATATRLSEEGAVVVIGDIDVEAARRTVERITEAGGRGFAVWFDLVDEGSCQALIDSAVAEYGRLDLLHNNAADLRPEVLGADTDISRVDIATWDRVLAANVRGFVQTSKAAIPVMLRNPGGAIVNTSSVAAFEREPRLPAYAASKAAVNALTRHIASRWGAEGIRCNSVAPGFTLTENNLRLTSERDRETALAAIPSIRLGRPEDIAAMVAMLLSDDGAWVNGQVISVDGGQIPSDR
jgi:NAD(P)-dependent dehydrogenase (short-subunit alcohol dehydrogenase family)